MGLRFLQERREAAEAARALYERAVAQARQPRFYANLGVPDSLDGRYDMVALHVFLLLRRLKHEGPAGARLAQCLFNVMFHDMDESLRELGAGDLGVGRRVKAMARAFYGRIAAYEAGLAGDDGVLAAALARNLFGTASARATQLAAFCAYLRREAKALAEQPFAEILAGQVRFGPAPALREAATPARRDRGQD